MRRFDRLLLACVLSLSPLAAVAEPFGFTSAFGKLYRVDLATGTTTEIGRIGQGDVEGLAFGIDGTLYGVSDATESLLRINTSTGFGTVIGSLGLAGQGTGSLNDLDFGLAVTCDGRMWLSADQADKLWSVNVATGATTLVGATGAHISGLAARNNDLYGIGVGGHEGLYRVNSQTGATLKIGDLAADLRFPDAGLDFDANGQLWAVIDFSPTDPNRPSEAVHVDPTTGAAVARKVMASFENEGLAIAPTECSREPTGPAPLVQTPALSNLALAALISLLSLFGTLAITRRPNP